VPPFNIENLKDAEHFHGIVGDCVFATVPNEYVAIANALNNGTTIDGRGNDITATLLCARK
jgi:hypothetical protein